MKTVSVDEFEAVLSREELVDSRWFRAALAFACHYALSLPAPLQRSQYMGYRHTAIDRFFGLPTLPFRSIGEMKRVWGLCDFDWFEPADDVGSGRVG